MKRFPSPRLAARHRSSRVAAVCALLGFALLASCSSESKKAGLVVAIQSDMAIPKDVDTVQIDVTAYGRRVFERRYAAGKNGLHVPGTLTILPSDQGATPVAI